MHIFNIDSIMENIHLVNNLLVEEKQAVFIKT